MTFSQKLIHVLAAAAVGLAGAALFASIHAPLPWMLGSMFATAVVTLASGFPYRMPRAARTFARPVIGVLAGSTFSPALFASAADWWPAFIVVGIFAFITTSAGYVFFRFVCRFDPTTSFFASTPAGLNEMSLLGDSLGGDLRTLVLVHATRILAVVSIIPLVVRTSAHVDVPLLLPEHPIGHIEDLAVLVACGLAGYFIGTRLPIPAGPMLISMLFSAAAHLAQITDAAPPSWLVSGVQVVIGCIAGARFAGIHWREARMIAVSSVAWAILIVGAAFLTAYTASNLVGIPFNSLLLSLAPGGMVEMTLIAYALGIEVAFVIACQIFRNVFTVLTLPYIYRLLHADRPEKPGPDQTG
ncbi:ammonia monooxygenase [Terrihabitans soli]|uniref:Ammonia monooxygenase n=1 Tax=Terrihabitans soli TaxID=708113 RepID=A0A6S6QES6_9HYPH|nr:AbrB family transcriptional regulator [Terrihabitans soli]BCJ89613.1 ammonia monooxygenase [Terrihabitans soli]